MDKNLISYAICSRFKTETFEQVSQRYKTTLHKDILVVNIDKEQTIILFQYGVYVCWSVNFENTKFFQDFLGDFCLEPFKQPIVEQFSYEIKDQFNINFDQVILGDDSIFAKIAVSTSLAQNIKLIEFEEKIESTIDKNSKIPTQLAQYGKINLNKKETAKKIGKLFLVKSRVNLHYDLLDTPEFFWEYPQYEHYYEKISRYLDIKSRIEVLNKKVEIIQELLDMLSNEQNHRYSSFLEWIIIILIGVEIVMGLWEHIFK
ncbi:hypothetical protein CRV08_09845 [Halarcobacter ebronensis]|uniref:DUF155 domain-containing protein n=1 Tax=Halarcobacter ebronensis TaxID=1462615 RepID=A0A4Q0YC88_9BACT|nr:RMD1 family protein [Halarcobacter ebronensis]RXJ67663.1 hypothetical protein CRV08_09845 [Halarcobacter ebronensis]